MRPLKISLLGEYWDSAIYKGRLYLFTRDGEVITIDWDRLISEWDLNVTDQYFFECAFSRSNDLYDEKILNVQKVTGVKQLLVDGFERMADRNYEIDKRRLERYVINKKVCPFPFPYSSMEIYKDCIYSAGRSGVYKTICGKRTSIGVGKKSEPVLRAPVFSVSASYGRLALAAGDTGLFEMIIDEGESSLDNSQKMNCTDCKWTYFNIFASSYVGSGYLREYSSVDEMTERGESRVVLAEKLFDKKGYSWGDKDKIYLLDGDAIRIKKYDPWPKAKEKFTDLGEIKLQNWKGQALTAKTSVFGTVIECEKALVIWHSDDTFYNIAAEPINWNVFTRARHYENHLHVVLKDCLDVYSFNHDYFVDQRSKKSGTYFSSKRFLRR